MADIMGWAAGRENPFLLSSKQANRLRLATLEGGMSPVSASSPTSTHSPASIQSPASMQTQSSVGFSEVCGLNSVSVLHCTQVEIRFRMFCVGSASRV